MITRVNHFSFTVANLEESVKFYTEVLGLTLVDKSPRPADFAEAVTGIPGTDIVVAYLEAKPCWLELIQYLAPHSVYADTKTCNIGSSHVCFFVDDFDPFVGKLMQDGAWPAGQVVQIPGGPNAGRKTVYMEDPDGNTLEFISEEVFPSG
jgi:catechol 2,3-dioxygenase-like lactoylglutathione lyase family enzyme